MDCLREEFTKGMVLNDRFETVAPLNQGSFGMVFLARDRETGNQVAIKCINRSTISEQPMTTDSETCDELECHTLLGNHRNIVNLVTSFETSSHIFLVLEYCPMGDLYEAIRLDRGPLQTENVRDFMLQLIDAVEYMHSKGLYHRDIKPENIFLTQNGDVKLGDFGLATTHSISFEACVGSDRYMAPEQYDPPSTGYSPAAADIWSVGICLLNVLFAKNPFVTPTQSDVLFADFTRDRQSLFDVFPNLSQDTFDILSAALCLDPTKRSLSEVRQAVLRAVTFTTDDDILDDFCTEDRSNVAGTTADREPLRTPSIQSPMVSQVESSSFPWAKALQSTPQKAGRQLSVIPDNNDEDTYSEDLFAPSESELGTSWFTVQPGTSVASDFTSPPPPPPTSTAASAAPMKTSQQKRAPISESVPVRPKLVPTVSQLFGKSSDIYSKSWSDLWEEEEELECLALRERQAQNARTYSQDSLKNKVVSSPPEIDSDESSSSSSSSSSSVSSSLLLLSSSAEMSPVLLDVSASVVDARATTPHVQHQPHQQSESESQSQQTQMQSQKKQQQQQQPQQQEQERAQSVERSAPISTPRPDHRSLENQLFSHQGETAQPPSSSSSSSFSMLSKTHQATSASAATPPPPPPRSPPKEPSMDQWAALGNRRRNCSKQARRGDATTITTPTTTVTLSPAKPMMMSTANSLHKKQSMNDNWRQGPLPASWAGDYHHHQMMGTCQDKSLCDVNLLTTGGGNHHNG
ncbi:hypothetical protein KEM54_001292 [Ascosphaera aggregata]|nr:hypothetical protein KEM54_001292 [Ascosphaera aggregata]